MARTHPERATLLRLGRVELPRSEVRALIRHLLRGCPSCAAAAAAILPHEFAAAGYRPRGSDYEGAFTRATRAVLAHRAAAAGEEAEAEELLTALAAHPYERQRMLVTQGSRYQTWAVCERLIAAAREAGFHDPARALELAEMAVVVAERLDAAEPGAERVADLAARAWATLGNARRIRSHFREAGEAFTRAERLLRQGTGDPLEKAVVLLFKASLMGEQRRIPEALALLDRGAMLARQAGDRHLEGKALIGRGVILGHAGDTAGAIDALRRGLELADPAVEHRLVAGGYHNLVFYLLESDRLAEALELFAQARPLYARLEDRMLQIRVRWLEGKLALAGGRFAEAEAELLAVRDEMLTRDLAYDVGMVSLDLIQLYTRLGRPAEVRRLAEEIIPLFASRDVHRETLAALSVLQRAAAEEGVTVGLAREVGEFLRRSRCNPGLKFRDPD